MRQPEALHCTTAGVASFSPSQPPKEPAGVDSDHLLSSSVHTSTQILEHFCLPRVFNCFLCTTFAPTSYLTKGLN